MSIHMPLWHLTVYTCGSADTCISIIVIIREWKSVCMVTMGWQAHLVRLPSHQPHTAVLGTADVIPPPVVGRATFECGVCPLVVLGNQA
jgi:hypothetical protein